MPVRTALKTGQIHHDAFPQLLSCDFDSDCRHGRHQIVVRAKVQPEI